MKRSVLTKILSVAALAIFAGLTASADPVSCSTIATLSQAEAANGVGGGCQIGNLVFNNFNSYYSPAIGVDPTAVNLTFNDITDGVDEDVYGTVGTPGTPLYTLVFDYSNTNDSVNAGMSGQYLVSYTVTDVSVGSSVVQLDNNVDGGVDSDELGKAVMTNNSLCNGGAFNLGTVGADSSAPLATCSQGPGNIYEVNDLADRGQHLATEPDNVYDSTSNTDDPEFQDAYGNVCYQPSDLSTPVCNQTEPNSAVNGGSFSGPNTPGSTFFGVYSRVFMSGGNASGSGFAFVDQTEQDFQEQTPEPGTLVLMGGALAALGLIRRKRSAVVR